MSEEQLYMTLVKIKFEFRHHFMTVKFQKNNICRKICDSTATGRLLNNNE